MMKAAFLCLATWALVQPALAGPPPDLARLQNSGYIMGPGSTTYPVNSTWAPANAFMKNVDALDAIAARVEATVCGTEQNKSVLIIGEPSQAFAYLLARMAGPRPGSPCPNTMWHVEVNVNKIEAGHKYVGEVEEYWANEVLAPADKKDVVMYLPNLDALVGVGSHSNDQDGIEREYAANIRAGRLRTVAFIDKYSYNEMIRSRAAYVLETFADRVIMPSITEEQTRSIATSYMKTLFPNLVLNAPELAYITKHTAYFQPNRQEPDRTLSVLNDLVRSMKDKGTWTTTEHAVNVQTAHPYVANTKAEFSVAQDADEISLTFDMFDTEASHDILKVYNAATGAEVGSFSGTLAAGTVTPFYPAQALRLLFTSDNDTHRQGFTITKIRARKSTKYTFTREDVRRSVLTVAQVPKWLMDRDYSVVRNLRAKLDADVVGIKDGKDDLIRLVKNGYVAGRTDEKPVATVMFAGPTGTGKSYIAKRVADYMEMKLVTIDMTSYKEPSSFGSFQELMARSLTNTPYAFYLFEEIDKASIEALDQLYFMMDEGVFYDKFQRPLFARGAFMMFTTNAGAEVILKDPNNPNLRSLVLTDLRKKFRDSFLNRFDAISIFKPFTDAEFVQLAQTLVNKKIANTRSMFEWTFKVDNATVQYLAVHGKSTEYGARPMERLVDATIGIGVAEFQLQQGNIPEGSTVEFKKLAAVHDMRITVGGKYVDYTVEFSENKIMSRHPAYMGNAFMKFLKANPVYTIHD